MVRGHRPRLQFWISERKGLRFFDFSARKCQIVPGLIPVRKLRKPSSLLGLRAELTRALPVRWFGGAKVGAEAGGERNEAKFRENVITIKTPEDLGVPAELAVGAGLDTGAASGVVSPDLVCPDSGWELRDAVISDGGEARTEAVGLREGDGAGIGEGHVQALPLFGSRAVARMGVDGRRAGGGLRAVRARERKCQRDGARCADREETRVKTGEGPRKEAARPEREKSLMRRPFESPPDFVEMVRQQLPREP
jgi:hypothetical protein